jgi:hypothetical protein
MKCRDYRDMIITDYLDREITAEKKKLVEEHLAECVSCREYMAAVLKSSIEPFKKVEKIAPSISVWTRIKETIEAENRPFLAPKVFCIPRNVFRPVFAMASVAVLVLFIGVLTKFYINRYEVARLRSQEKIVYFASLFGENGYTSDSEDIGYGTAIEEYFL